MEGRLKDHHHSLDVPADIHRPPLPRLMSIFSFLFLFISPFSCPFSSFLQSGGFVGFQHLWFWAANSTDRLRGNLHPEDSVELVSDSEGGRTGHREQAACGGATGKGRCDGGVVPVTCGLSWAMETSHLVKHQLNVAVKVFLKMGFMPTVS